MIDHDTATLESLNAIIKDPNTSDDDRLEAKALREGALRRQRKIAIVQINIRMLYELLGIPEDFIYLGGNFSWNCDCAQLKLAHENFRPTEDGSYLPIALMQVEYKNREAPVVITDSLRT